MPLSQRQRYCLDQMGITVWRLRDDLPQLHWLGDKPGDSLKLLLICAAKPEGQWLSDLLTGLRVSAEQAAWCESAEAADEHAPRWLFTLPEHWPSPDAKRALWRQAQEQFRV